MKEYLKNVTIRDLQELANVKDASADPRYNDIDKEDIDKDI